MHSSRSSSSSSPPRSITSSSRRSVVLLPFQMAENSVQTDLAEEQPPRRTLSSSISSSHSSLRQPRMAERSASTSHPSPTTPCPSSTISSSHQSSTSQQTTWPNVRKKLERNIDLISRLPLFEWPRSYYDAPVFINRCTTSLTLISCLHRIANVHHFMIDTESDCPTRDRPFTTPALLQIQAIHDEHQATVSLFEVQHLPPSSSELFSHIRNLCHAIFSLNNCFLAWGNVKVELQSFLQFDLFDISNIFHVINLQQRFTNRWNEQHPHSQECLDNIFSFAKRSVHKDPLSRAILESDSDNEPDDDMLFADLQADSAYCICPSSSRPYKSHTAQWALQKAVEVTFNRALDKTHTVSTWSCGLDPPLHQSLSRVERADREALVLYAINDLFAPTLLYFHLLRSAPSHLSDTIPICRSSTTALSSSTSTTTDPISSSSTSSSKPSSTSSSIPPPSSTVAPRSSPIPLFLVIGDSHLTFLPRTSTTDTYRLVTHTISGLRWYNPFEPDLCATNLLQTSSISSTLSSVFGVILVVGTNSLRTSSATLTIEHMKQFISDLRSSHPHLTSTNSLTISLTFPCQKFTKQFPNTLSLSSNINEYNQTLLSLANILHFSIIEFPIDPVHLKPDGIHIHHRFNHILSSVLYHHLNHLVSLIEPSRQLPTSHSIEHADDYILELDAPADAEFSTLDVNQPESPPEPVKPRKHRRSAAFRKVRNKQRHIQLHFKRSQHTLRHSSADSSEPRTSLLEVSPLAAKGSSRSNSPLSHNKNWPNHVFLRTYSLNNSSSSGEQTIAIELSVLRSFFSRSSYLLLFIFFCCLMLFVLVIFFPLVIL